MKEITVTPEKRSGQPCVQDTRVTVNDVLGWIIANVEPVGIEKDLVGITTEDVKACIEYAQYCINKVNNVE